MQDPCPFNGSELGTSIGLSIDIADLDTDWSDQGPSYEPVVPQQVNIALIFQTCSFGSESLTNMHACWALLTSLPFYKGLSMLLAPWRNVSELSRSWGGSGWERKRKDRKGKNPTYFPFNNNCKHFRVSHHSWRILTDISSCDPQSMRKKRSVQPKRINWAPTRS